MGIIGRPKGLKGEAHFFPSNRDLESYDFSFWKEKIFFLSPNHQENSPSIILKKKEEQNKFTKIEKIKKEGEKIIIKFPSFETREQVQNLCNYSLYLKRKDFPLLLKEEEEENLFYYIDLLGLNVLDVDTGKDSGIIKDFYEGPQGIILSFSEKNLLDLPLNSPFIIKIEWENKKIWIKKPDYV